MNELERLLGRAMERSEISKLILDECDRVKKLRDSYPQGSEMRKNYRLMLEGLLIAADIVVSR